MREFISLARPATAAIEIGAIALAKVCPEGLLLDSFIVVKQEATSSHVDMDASAILHACERGEATGRVLVGWVHSHREGDADHKPSVNDYLPMQMYQTGAMNQYPFITFIVTKDKLGAWMLNRAGMAVAQYLEGLGGSYG